MSLTIYYNRIYNKLYLMLMGLWISVFTVTTLLILFFTELSMKSLLITFLLLGLIIPAIVFYLFTRLLFKLHTREIY